MYLLGLLVICGPDKSEEVPKGSVSHFRIECHVYISVGPRVGSVPAWGRVDLNGNLCRSGPSELRRQEIARRYGGGQGLQLDDDDEGDWSGAGAGAGAGGRAAF